MKILKNLIMNFAIITFWMLLFRIMKQLLHVTQSFVEKTKFNLQQWLILMEVVLPMSRCNQLTSLTIVIFTLCFAHTCCSTTYLFSIGWRAILKTTLSRFLHPCEGQISTIKVSQAVNGPPKPSIFNTSLITQRAMEF